MPLSSHIQQAHNVSTILAGFQRNSADDMAVSQNTAPRSAQQPPQPQPHLPAPTPPTQQPPLPPPQLFDILPALHELLARIDHSSSTTDPASSSPPTDPNDPASEPLALNYSNLHPLDPKDLPSAILPLKAQMRRGLVELGRLADMERSVLEQGEEIGALEDKVRRQEGVLRGLGGRARGVEVGLGG
ncbi:hypothetical protein LTR01_007186 [Friedmanniomyces endolithicus]|nr:hypothetical protein LTR01_007186 [Friedmanniomyces endolithicus]